MKQPKISKRNELPKDFSLEKYEQTVRFGIAEWAVNLEMRVLTAHVISHKRIHPEENFDAEKATELILQKPIWSGDRKLSRRSCFLPLDRSPCTVIDMTVSDYFFGGSEYLDEGMKPYLESFKRTNEPPYAARDHLYDTPLWKAYDDIGLNAEDDVFVQVALHASEEKIVSDFRKWLRNIRETRGIQSPSKKITDTDFKLWSDYKLLPYLDLSNWALARNIQITQQVIGAALFPDEYDVSLAERVRKVVAPMARSVAHEAFTDALRVQALGDLAEQNSDKLIPDKFDNVIIADDGLVLINPD